MVPSQIKVCVFCGSTIGANPAYAESAILLGSLIGSSGLGLVYGGGGSGLMGLLAKSAMQHNGYVIGIMPSALVTDENAMYQINEYRQVDSFHERKRLMSDLSDVFVALPGGPGTLEELIEQLAWSEMGLHDKPIFLLNTNGYWNPLIKLLETLGTSKDKKKKYFIVDSPKEVVHQILEKF